ncbi:MAG: hypothetical protein COV67_14055 [Nitrospinae bacterium CG11_big_fil_rev_8_21_14_0_20_56_8]|nr:MAG: hypothetical protein COV67_14055 [Nitrospinae bacterium CG11_big_fil_rev_8_21_14_0_20_56_8]
MKSWSGMAVGGALLLVFCLFEFYGNIVERAIGNYLKWQNSDRPQLGRIWERDRKAVLAQRKIESIRELRTVREQTARDIGSLRELLEGIDVASGQLISREKFLQLFYDFPGDWPAQLISPYDLIQIDANKSWDRVLLKRFGPWITIEFIDPENLPVKEIFLSLDLLMDPHSDRTLRRGTLEEAEFRSNRIFSADQFLSLLKRLDPKTQQEVFPDPRWFLEKGYNITRVGVSDISQAGKMASAVHFGIEYETDFFTEILLIAVPVETANNLLSQIEFTGSEGPGEEVTPLELSPGTGP